MPKIPPFKPKEVIKILEQNGFVFARQKGSHKMFVKGKIGVTVAYHNKELKPKTLHHIIQKSGIEIEKFL
jgi:predicted RNA binding protein YcfA (HicA-like mRNA interferase family)